MKPWVPPLPTGRPPQRVWLHRSLTAMSVILVVGSGFVLFRMLRGIDWANVVTALSNLQWGCIAIAAALVAGSYAMLTLYDYLALRTLGFSTIPYAVAALASFASYAIAHNVGATMVTAGIVRYRVYSSHGLDSLAVAKVSLVAGFTFWLGNAAVLGLGMMLYPDAATPIDQLSPSIHRAAGLLILVVLGSYVAWAWQKRRQFGSRELGIELPDGSSALVQIGIGAVDLACCAMAMYVLVPAGYDGGPVRFAVVFVCAALLGFASHAPGGIGVFDAAMLIGLPEFDKAALLASLIAFRVLYYVVPLATALAIMAVREALLAAGRDSVTESG